MRDHVLGRQKTDPSVRALNISSAGTPRIEVPCWSRLADQAAIEAMSGTL